jgi:hypothetical protein
VDAQAGMPVPPFAGNTRSTSPTTAVRSGASEKLVLAAQAACGTSLTNA